MCAAWRTWRALLDTLSVEMVLLAAALQAHVVGDSRPVLGIFGVSGLAVPSMQLRGQEQGPNGCFACSKKNAQHAAKVSAFQERMQLSGTCVHLGWQEEQGTDPHTAQ